MCAANGNSPPWWDRQGGVTIAILLIPTLILLADELRWKREEAPGPEPARPSFRPRTGGIPWRTLIGAGVLLLALIWTAGTNSYGMVVGFGVVFAGIALFAWQRHRSVVRSVLRDLRPPEKS
jgi:hypothetical protein